jgi:hypothetical protein
VAARLLLHYDGFDITWRARSWPDWSPPWGGRWSARWARHDHRPRMGGSALAIGCGFASGGIREACPKEAIWRFSPFVLGDVPRHIWRIFRRFEIDWQLVLLAAPMALLLLQQTIGHRWPTRIYALNPQGPFLTAMVYLGTILCIAAPIKIWNDARIEHRVREQKSSLKAHQRPHQPDQSALLFNTLASILAGPHEARKPRAR